MKKKRWLRELLLEVLINDPPPKRPPPSGQMLLKKYPLPRTPHCRYVPVRKTGMSTFGRI
jgi:hypothetical protein